MDSLFGLIKGLILLTWLVGPVLVFFDARRHSTSSVRWALAAAVMPVIGALLWLMHRATLPPPSWSLADVPSKIREGWGHLLQTDPSTPSFEDEASKSPAGT